jgi:uncharacterized protein (TIGR02300 family)
MSQKEARGTKRTCLSCSSRFYDLKRDPITCPICGTPFVMTAGDVAAAALEAAPKPKAIKPAIKEKVFAEVEPLAEGVEIPEMESTEALAEIESEETEVAGDDEGDVFLEEEEEGASDVTSLIDNPVEGEEEP